MTKHRLPRLLNGAVHLYLREFLYLSTSVGLAVNLDNLRFGL